ncbi:hypothetical protein SCLCIDRAFT_408891 [Scleroderma citrinum Foug A]|uniref:Uncharacterized protein n=1 Tax=Scleroderma citrinum Foug A TaxID=1036808 RepID=A0A0C3CZ58_9AGAM|nr:hypothetical protein SCLCIDRAFT_408891 [Scleroderma citrinum Foug A]
MPTSMQREVSQYYESYDGDPGRLPVPSVSKIIETKGPDPNMRELQSLLHTMLPPQVFHVIRATITPDGACLRNKKDSTTASISIVIRNLDGQSPPTTSWIAVVAEQANMPNCCDSRFNEGRLCKSTDA